MERSHPSLDITGSLGTALAGRTIVLALCGSVAAVQGPELARLLMRHGARVIPVMSREATELITARMMHWSTGHEPVTELTGSTEHVGLVGNVVDRADLLLIAPATANTIGKIAAGIDDGPVTTVATTAIGEGMPVVVVPAMHEPMYRHPIVLRNPETLREIGITVVMPRVEEGKAKIATSEEVKRCVIDRLASSDSIASPAPLAGRRVLVTVGRTVEYLDPIRVITNNSSGKMGMAVAQAALDAGAEVTVVYGKGSAPAPGGVRVVRVDTAEQMRNACWNELSAGDGYDVMVAAAAVGDWKPVSEQKKKISTHDRDRLVIELEPTPKIIDGVRGRFPRTLLVAFRAQHDLALPDLLADARARAKKADADLIAVNDVSHAGAGFETDTNEMYLIARDGTETHIPLASKLVVGRRIIEAIADLL
ncbi:MAG: bifunctional phosphopantothenoylcysteine decarboxylase/phosphopantothenate--cysteine ligase CoaBC [Spirochaetota bacterium]